MKRTATLLLALALLISLALPALAVEEEEDGMMYITITSVPDTPADAESYARGALSGVMAADNGACIVTDTFNKVLWTVGADGSAVRYAGAIPVEDVSGVPQGLSRDGTLTTALFTEPWAAVPFLEGCAVTDSDANVIRYIAGDEVYTLAGTGRAASADGSARSASFDRPTGLAAGDDGLLYIADSGSGAIRTMTPEGKVSTLLRGLAAPTGLAWHDGALYVAETGRCRILKVTGAAYTVLAGSAEPAEDAGEYYGGFADGPAASALFDHPEGVAVGADGTVYIADTGNAAVRMLKNGRVYTLARNDGELSFPVAPRSLLPADGKLLVTDPLSPGLTALSLPAASYDDVRADDWFAEAAAETTLRGLIRGTADRTFDPNVTLSRAMFVTILSRLQQSADGTAVIDGDAAFPDVPADAWYAAAARWAADRGVTEGVDGGRFDPDGDITREQLVTMLRRWAAAEGFDVTVSGVLDAFPDADTVSDWAADAMRWAVGRGLINGLDGKLAPEKPATRAEAAAVMLRFMDGFGL